MGQRELLVLLAPTTAAAAAPPLDVGQVHDILHQVTAWEGDHRGT
jgi:hypothetical protein